MPREGDDYHAIVVTNVNVQHGDDEVVMLTLRHLLCEVARVMVIDERQTAENMRVGFSFKP